MKKFIQFLGFAGIGVAVMALVYRSQNAAFQEQCRLDGIPSDQCSLSDKLLNDFSLVHPGWLLAVVAAFTLSNLFRALRWNMLLEPLGYQPRTYNSFLTILLGYFANLGLPRMGEVVRAGSLARYERIPVEKVMGTLFVDRLMDFLCLGLVVSLAFLLQGGVLMSFLQRGGQSGGGSGMLLWLALAGLTGLALLWLMRHWLMKMTFVQKIAGVLSGFREGLRSVFRLERPALFIAYSLGIWLMFYLQCYWNLKAFVPTEQLNMAAALMVFVFGTLGFVIPSPGGMGTYHALCIAGLGLYSIGGSDAFSYANISFFTIQIFYNIIGGVLALLLLPALNRRSNP